MSAIIDPQTINVDDLPGIWSPVQWELSEDERIAELNEQARASLMFAIDAPEAILRLLLDESDIDRTFDAPDGYDPEQQGEWEPDLLTFSFKRRIRPIKIERSNERLYIEYQVESAGYWAMTIEAERVEIQRI